VILCRSLRLELIASPTENLPRGDSGQGRHAGSYAVEPGKDPAPRFKARPPRPGRRPRRNQNSFHRVDETRPVTDGDGVQNERLGRIPTPQRDLVRWFS